MEEWVIRNAETMWWWRTRLSLPIGSVCGGDYKHCTASAASNSLVNFLLFPELLYESSKTQRTSC
jgi:hypothetical protein